MASIVASLLPPLLLPSRNSHPGTFPAFPVSLLSGRRSNVSLVVKASRESAESSTSLTVFKSVQNVWDQPEDRLGLFGLGFAAVAAFWASTNLVAAIDKLPLFPAVFELIGIFYSLWFTYRYLVFKPDREELFQILNKSATDILGQ
ncbi:protein CURVATURE THYLAKOID 1C, chloroplastic [Vigna radiata var. radiata]|uniref:Protein CURVATURE THYLAKOID 1C, chloroplastic n=1 Tax=Vigna radiata var. radiata TaxID=3916 RepID=A0A1S3V9Y0_VIGRR|nr:protein CURVATURE THYLAKOID 1C, chloroplastic [Vigna radiata var. radiata]